jgi:hypothetical protein
MVGGRARSAAPRDLAEDPQAWPTLTWPANRRRRCPADRRHPRSHSRTTRACRSRSEYRLSRDVTHADAQDLRSCDQSWPA